MAKLKPEKMISVFPSVISLVSCNIEQKFAVCSMTSFIFLYNGLYYFALFWDRSQLLYSGIVFYFRGNDTLYLLNGAFVYEKMLNKKSLNRLF